jgi:hypothetical protein
MKSGWANVGLMGGNGRPGASHVPCLFVAAVHLLQRVLITVGAQIIVYYFYFGPPKGLVFSPPLRHFRIIYILGTHLNYHWQVLRATAVLRFSALQI